MGRPMIEPVPKSKRSLLGGFGAMMNKMVGRSSKKVCRVKAEAADDAEDFYDDEVMSECEEDEDMEKEEGEADEMQTEAEDFNGGAASSTAGAPVGAKTAPTTAPRTGSGGAAEKLVKARDYTRVAKQMDEQFEKLDPDSTLRPTIITPGSSWTKSSQPKLLAARQTESLEAEAQHRMKDAAFDLLDAITKSGALPLSHAEMHIVVAATHCFDQTVTETVIQENVNPIEKVERSSSLDVSPRGSSLIMASTVHQQPPSALLNASVRPRVLAASPQLADTPKAAELERGADVPDADASAKQRAALPARTAEDDGEPKPSEDKKNDWDTEGVSVSRLLPKQRGVPKEEILVEQLAATTLLNLAKIAIFRGAFFGVEPGLQSVKRKHDLRGKHPPEDGWRHVWNFPKEVPLAEAAPKATRRLLEDCAAGRLRDRRFAPVSALMAVLGGGDLGPFGDPEAETGVGLGHTEPGMLTVSRKNDFAGGAGVLFSQSVATVIFRHNLFGGIGQV
ncbi:unnamed protein product [Durusdinium trenchii]|uniref:Condensin complex subunit 2 n=1 Tax=Durusdinium trenchii TaxID=1381693 RepID=A0ABP0PQI7_9DINO